jgi:hypothetical protein
LQTATEEMQALMELLDEDGVPTEVVG